jgi:hypothetical protein
MLPSPTPLPPSSPAPTPTVYELTPLTPSSIATASPSPSSPETTEATEAEPDSRRTQEQANITSTRNSDAKPIKKSEQEQVPRNNHNNSSSEDKTARDNNNDTGNLEDGNNNRNHAFDLGTRDDSKLVFDPGGNIPNCKDDATHDTGGSTINIGRTLKSDAVADSSNININNSTISAFDSSAASTVTINVARTLDAGNFANSNSIVKTICIPTGTTARKNEPEHECVRALPLEVYHQVPPFAAPMLDKPEEPPPSLSDGRIATCPNSQACKSLAHRLRSPARPYRPVRRRIRAFQQQSTPFCIASGRLRR